MLNTLIHWAKRLINDNLKIILTLFLQREIIPISLTLIFTTK